ncbi:hypothetical protein B0O99DRAFT_636305 [Bisporella sp. PMI_857]|nr:hypothetical protein B0O99DRAFT_636305 [Bisporella sp. PMI_857]
MDSKITSTSIAAAPPLINESAVINASLSSVWRLVKLKEFVNFYTAISKSELVSSANEEKDIVRWTFQDGTVLEVKEEEYSTEKHYMSFNIIKCEPWGLPYTGVLSTIHLYPITSGFAEGSTFIQWSGYYSADASADMVQDARAKRREGLADLAKAVEKK